MTIGPEVRYRTITRTRLRGLDQRLQVSTLRDIYRDNAGRLARAVDFCARRNIYLYRIPSGLFPQSEEPPGYELVDELAPLLTTIGERAESQGIRLVMHPDQFVVLSSESPKVVANSITILEHHARILDLLQQPRSAWTAIQIHGGKGGRGEHLVRVIKKLPEAIRSRIALENDESAYGASEILEVCKAAGVPMVFDAHHHVVHEGLASYDDPSVEEMTRAAAATWPDPEWQLVHISNGRDSFSDPKHADFIETMPAAYREVPWIEVEAKSKEEAVERLRRRWKP